MDSPKSDENTKLKHFISSLNSGNLSKFIDSNQAQFQEKWNSLCVKFRQSEEEITRQYQQLQQNSHLIEKFQNQVQDVSKQNSELLEQQQVLKEENENLKNQLQYSEDKFAQLDILYDEEISVLNEAVAKLQAQIDELNNVQHKTNNQFDETQSELYNQLKHSEEVNTELKKQLNYLLEQIEDEKKDMKSEIDTANELNETLTKKIADCEKNINDLQNSLTAALSENKEISVLKVKIETLNKAREAEENESRIEKSRLIAVNEDFKLIVDDLKKKLLAKEKETEEVFLKFKQLTKSSNLCDRFSARKRSSTDDPKAIQSSSDSENSTISFYKFPKRRQISTESDDDNVFSGFKNPNKIENMRRSGALENKTIPANKKRKCSGIPKQHIEIPESPVVSSSAFTNMDQK